MGRGLPCWLRGLVEGQLRTTACWAADSFGKQKVVVLGSQGGIGRSHRAHLRRKGRSGGGGSDPTGKIESVSEAAVSGRGPPGSRRSQMQWRLGGD